MFVRTMCYPVTVLGPGRRLGIWLSGCSRGCPGCMSPELQVRRTTDEVPVEKVAQMAVSRADAIDGITVSGGEPFDQADELCELLGLLASEVSEDIIVYTGRTYEEICADPRASRVLEHVATLIDGPYVEGLDDGRGLRGSSNQRVLRMKPLPHFDFEGASRQVQSFVFDNQAFVVGVG